MPDFAQDLRVAARGLRRAPGYAAVAVLTLGLGIGAATAVFSLVKAVLLDPLPFSDASQLVRLWGNVQRQVVERRGTSYPDFEDWRHRNQSFTEVSAYWNGNFILHGGEAPERLNGEVVSWNYFRMLGAEPNLGRVFRKEDDQPDAVRLVVLSESLWRSRFGGSPHILGTAIRLGDDHTHLIIGVMPKGFRGLSGDAALWVAARPSLSRGEQSRGSRWFAPVARLKPGVSVAQAQTDMTGIARQLEQAWPDTNEKRGVEVASLKREMIGDLREALLVVFGAVGLLLLIACTNVAGLLLARAQTRAKEVAVRIALGAGRSSLLRQVTAESLLLSLAGALVGIGLAAWGIDLALQALPVELPGHVEVRLHPAVLGFAIAISLIAALGIGAVPAVGGLWRGVAENLKEGTARTSLSRDQHRARTFLVVSQVALALVLLAGAGLLVKSLVRLARVDPGFRTQDVLSMYMSLPRGVNPEGASPAARRIREDLSSLTGVESVSLASDLPLSGDGGAIFYTAEGQEVTDAQRRPRAYVHRVAEGFFRTLGIPLRKGRDFRPEEMDAKRNVVIVTANLVERFWPGQDPVGKRIRPGGLDSKAPWLEIVGVVDELLYRALPRNPTQDPDIFFPFADQARNFALLVKTRTDAAAFAGSIQKRLREVAGTTVAYNIATLDERAREHRARSRFLGWLTALFAATALLLAMIGLYGVLSQQVSRRTREIGIRMALGAVGRDVIAMVVRQTVWLVGVGAVAGAIGALAISQYLRTLLFEVSPADPTVMAAVGGLVFVVALAAAWSPARRATRVDPIAALRQE